MKNTRHDPNQKKDRKEGKRNVYFFVNFKFRKCFMSLSRVNDSAKVIFSFSVIIISLIIDRVTLVTIVSEYVFLFDM